MKAYGVTQSAIKTKVERSHIYYLIVFLETSILDNSIFSSGNHLCTEPNDAWNEWLIGGEYVKRRLCTIYWTVAIRGMASKHSTGTQNNANTIFGGSLCNHRSAGLCGVI